MKKEAVIIIKCSLELKRFEQYKEAKTKSMKLHKWKFIVRIVAIIMII